MRKRALHLLSLAWRAVFVGVLTLGLSAPAFAKPKTKTSTTAYARSGSLAPGVTAAIYLRPTPAASASPEQAIQKALEEGRRLFHDLDGQTSGEVGRINKAAGRSKVMIKVSEPFLTLLRVCQQITDWTQGLFDVVRGPSEKVETLLVDFQNAEVRLPKKKSWLDFAGIRKGYAVDRMAGVLKSEGYTDFMIQAGMISRTMGRNGPNYWSLTVPDAHGSQSGLCRVSLESSSLATADTRILPPDFRTDLRSVTVVTKNATNATALSRTALVAGQARARNFLSPLIAQGFGAILEDQNGKIQTLGDITAACFEE